MPSAIGAQSMPPSSTTLTVWAGVIGCGFTGHVGGVATVRGAGRVAESTNLMVLAGDHVRFIGSVEGTQALRVGNREGMVFPAHRTSGGVLLLVLTLVADRHLHRDAVIGPAR